jgi:hypothetical protein
MGDPPNARGDPSGADSRAWRLTGRARRGLARVRVGAAATQVRVRFVDGNKRVAFMAAYVFLGLNGYDLDADEPQIVATMEGVAASKVTEAALAKWFKAHLQPIQT